MRTSDITALVPVKTATPTPQRMATRGTVAIPPASVTDDTLTVTLPSYSPDYGWPCRWVRQGNTLPAIGAECLVLWDETGAGTVVSFAGAPVDMATQAELDAAIAAAPELLAGTLKISAKRTVVAATMAVGANAIALDLTGLTATGILVVSMAPSTHHTWTWYPHIGLGGVLFNNTGVSQTVTITYYVVGT